MRIAVFSTYDVTPGENGGEIRFLNIYRRLSQCHEVRILSYDLRCQAPMQRCRVAPALDIVNTGVSHQDRYGFFMATERMGLFSHDVMCASGYEFSREFLAETRAALAWADTVVVTTPFLSGLVFPLCNALHLKIYEAHNVERRAKAQFLATSRDVVLAEKFLTDTIRSEALALEAADIVVAVSDEDASGFVTDYRVNAAKIRLVPNGVAVALFDAIPDAAKRDFRKVANLAENDVGVFLGSAYGPNVDSYRQARQWLDEAGFKGTVLVVGRIIDAYNPSWSHVRFSEHWLGFVDDTVKRLLVSAADFALHIVAGGGGTNVKLFDYMAAGIPILANAFGARGVRDDGWFIPIDSAVVMHHVVGSRFWRSEQAARAAQAAHGIALREFDWDQIAERYKIILS